MRRRLLSLATLTFLGAIGGPIGAVWANENVTIWNNSNQPIVLQAVWNVPPYTWPPYTLLPGANHTISAPNGTAVSVRFNATPADSTTPRWVTVPVATAFEPNLLGRGAFSCFRNVTPLDVNLFAMNIQTTQGLQLALLTLGYDPGPIDGIYGPQTISAVMAFQTANALVVDGNAGVQTRTSLRSAAQLQTVTRRPTGRYRWHPRRVSGPGQHARGRFFEGGAAGPAKRCAPHIALCANNSAVAEEPSRTPLGAACPPVPRSAQEDL